MKGQELVEGKDRPLWWRMEHSGGLWAMVLVAEAYAQDAGLVGLDAPIEQGIRLDQWRSSRWALKQLCNSVGAESEMESPPTNLQKEPSGKPYLMNPDGAVVPVALAHTVGMGAAALSGHRGLLGIGVDVEQYSERFLRVVSRVANKEEIEKVQRCVQEGLESKAAVLIWVIKEACYKSALYQDNLFGKNQIITQIEKKIEPFTLEEPRWTGWVESIKSDPFEQIEFEAGSFSQDQALWYWAVAWRQG